MGRRAPPATGQVANDLPAMAVTAELGPSSQAPLNWALHLKHRCTGTFISSNAALGTAVSSTATLGPSSQAPLNWAPPPQAPLHWAPPSQAPLNWAPPSQAPLHWAPPSQAPLNWPLHRRHRWPMSGRGWPASVSGRAARGTLGTMPPPEPVETVQYSPLSSAPEFVLLVEEQEDYRWEYVEFGFHAVRIPRGVYGGERFPFEMAVSAVFLSAELPPRKRWRIG
ncbi:hypothetical protein NDU88_002099 [Pleurodeles waltl]|uniref:Uncharacterized protein n=1 Tax=Pleurodeles waltl TaxID=8319 RepID=A0AAV7T1B5_PLEWA|nr:hypothetical protein NDU88_002099 [Pleurodeles waltl]